MEVRYEELWFAALAPGAWRAGGRAWCAEVVWLVRWAGYRGYYGHDGVDGPEAWSPMGAPGGPVRVRWRATDHVGLAQPARVAGHSQLDGHGHGESALGQAYLGDERRSGVPNHQFRCRVGGRVDRPRKVVARQPAELAPGQADRAHTRPDTGGCGRGCRGDNQHA